MGASQSTLPVIQQDLSSFATIPLEKAQEAQQALAEQAQNIAAQAAAATSPFAKLKFGFWIVVGVAVLASVVIFADWSMFKISGKDFLGIWKAPPPTVDPSKFLYIDKATYASADGKNSKDVTSVVQGMVTNYALPSFVVSPTALKLTDKDVPRSPAQNVNKLTIEYHIGSGASGGMQTAVPVSVNDAEPTPTLPSSMTAIPATAQTPSVLSRVWGTITGAGTSGNLISGSSHDATSTATVSANDAPLSAEDRGTYGMQWWMYVNDWNYGYGKDKAVIKRTDSTNAAIANPSISLHPTDNTLNISVSLFPSKDGSTGKSEPAPVGHSGMSDDVYVCSVPNIPLQSWFSVGVTVFGRNLDVYIDGKLVKSCFLPGVPKPAAGDIQLTPAGGFSGHICNFYHYSRMLNPVDASDFYSSGTSCTAMTTPSAVSKATGYSVKFGVFDSTGKTINQYTF
jgi:hypothetical protein